MIEYLATLALAIVCIFKKHNYIAINEYNHCARCGKLVVRNEKNAT